MTLRVIRITEGILRLELRVLRLHPELGELRLYGVILGLHGVLHLQWCRRLDSDVGQVYERIVLLRPVSNKRISE